MVCTCPANSRSPENALKLFPVLEYVLEYRIFGFCPRNVLKFCVDSVSVQTCLFAKYIGCLSYFMYDLVSFNVIMVTVGRM